MVYVAVHARIISGIGTIHIRPTTKNYAVLIVVVANVSIGSQNTVGYTHSESHNHGTERKEKRKRESQRLKFYSKVMIQSTSK